EEVLAKVMQLPPNKAFPYHGVAPPETSVERAARLREENRKRALETAQRRMAEQTEAHIVSKAAEPAAASVPAVPKPEIEVAAQVMEPIAEVDRTSLVSRLDAHERTRGGSVPSIGTAREPRFYL